MNKRLQKLTIPVCITFALAGCTISVGGDTRLFSGITFKSQTGSGTQSINGGLSALDDVEDAPIEIKEFCLDSVNNGKTMTVTDHNGKFTITCRF